MESPPKIKNQPLNSSRVKIEVSDESSSSSGLKIMSANEEEDLLG